MSLNIYVGKNKTGKTKAIQELNNLSNKFTLYLPTEMILKDFISKENFGTAANKILSPLAKVIKFINDIYSIKTKTKLSVKNKNKIQNNINIMNEMMIEMKEDSNSDIYFEKNIVGNLKIKNINDIEVINEIDWLKIINLNFDHDKKWHDDVSSGSSSYSLLKLIFNFLIFINKNNDNNVKREIKNYQILIDEPEKFCHPELIHKIADLIYQLSKTFDMTISTHSNILLERIFMVDKEKKTKYFYFSKTKNENDNTYTYNNHYELKLSEQLKKCNHREVSLIIKSIFSTNIILHEGLADEIYLNSLLESIKTDKYITFLDCYSKAGVIKIIRILDNLKLTNNINPLLSYDLDRPKKYIKDNHHHFIAMDPNLEKNFFKPCNNKDGEFELKNGESITKKKIISIMNEKEILNNSTLLEVKNIIENHKVEIIHWLENKEKHYE